MICVLSPKPGVSPAELGLIYVWLAFCTSRSQDALSLHTRAFRQESVHLNREMSFSDLVRFTALHFHQALGVRGLGLDWKEVCTVPTQMKTVATTTVIQEQKSGFASEIQLKVVKTKKNNTKTQVPREHNPNLCICAFSWYPDFFNDACLCVRRPWL